MRLLLMICLILSLVFVSCDNTTESITQEVEQTQSITKEAVAETTTIENTTNEDASVEENTEVVETTIKTPATPKKRPILSFDNKTFDYGMIEQGDKVNHTFRFTNKGNSDLIIKNAEASCGCTTPTYPFVPIKPGETGNISVTFNSTGKMGTQRPNITVTSNSYPRTQTLYLEGFVTHQIAEKEEATSLIEEDVNLDTEGNTTKGEDIEEVTEDNN